MDRMDTKKLRHLGQTISMPLQAVLPGPHL